MKDSNRGFSLETHCLEGSFETLVDEFLDRSTLEPVASDSATDDDEAGDGEAFALMETA